MQFIKLIDVRGLPVIINKDKIVLIDYDGINENLTYRVRIFLSGKLAVTTNMTMEDLLQLLNS